MTSSSDNQHDKQRIDEQLLPYLQSTDKVETQEHLNRLLEKARPIVYRIARSVRIGTDQTVVPFNTQDIFGDICVQLIQKLRACKNDPRQHPISNFSGLVATTTSGVFADFMRGRDRQRRSLYQNFDGSLMPIPNWLLGRMMMARWFAVMPRGAQSPLILQPFRRK